MAVSGDGLILEEQPIYGLTGLGQLKRSFLVKHGADLTNVTTPTMPDSSLYGRILELKRYESADHLSNVRAVYSDRKLSTLDINNDPIVSSFTVDAEVVNNYYPFGSLMPGRSYNSSSYRNGFQGQESDPEIKGHSNSINYKYRMHDPRIGRFFAIDPLAPEYPYNSPYAFSENRVVDGIELEGLEWKSEHKWSDEATDAHLKNAYGDDWEAHKGETYEDLWSARAPAILERQEGETFDCADLSLYAMIEFAAYYKLPVHIEDYKAEGTDPVFDNSNYGFQHPTKGWITFKEGEWKRFAENVGAHYGASDLFHNNKIAEDISFDDVKAGDLIGIKYSTTTYHSQTVHSVSRPTLWWHSYTTIQGSLRGGEGIPAERKTFTFDYIEDEGQDSKARRWKFDYFDKHK
jgi:RHS repeat-associated protein